MPFSKQLMELFRNGDGVGGCVGWILGTKDRKTINIFRQNEINLILAPNLYFVLNF